MREAAPVRSTLKGHLSFMFPNSCALCVHCGQRVRLEPILELSRFRFWPENRF